MINTEVTSRHIGRKKREHDLSLTQSIIQSVRFLQTDKVRPKEKTSKEKTPVSLKQKAIYIEFMQRHIQLLFPKAEHGHVISTS